MPQQLITSKDVENAYILHKGEVYNDRSNLHKRIKIAEFEASGNMQKTFDEIAYAINSYDKDGWLIVGNYYNKDDDDVMILPHTFEKDDETVNKLSNRHCNFKLSKVVALFDESIELDIINALWLMNVGIYLEYNVNNSQYTLADKDLYGSILNVDEKGGFKGKRLFKHYPYKYNDWIDNGIKVAKAEISKGEDVSLISLDLKDFYHSLLISYQDLPNGKNGEIGRILNEILGDVARHHMNKLGIEREDEFSFLPVGPYSSPVIANWLLRDLDNCFKSEPNCIYYGRYIDDIIMVFHSNENFTQITTIEDFLDLYNYSGILSNNAEEDGRHIKIKLSSSRNYLEFNKDKFKIAVLQNIDPIAISSFARAIRETSSFSDDYEEDEDFGVEDDQADVGNENDEGSNIKSSSALSKNEYSFYKSETEQFRELLKKDNPRFEIAVQLDKIIAEQLTGPYEKDKELSSLLVGFFQGNYVLSFYNLWERVYTYLFAIEDIDSVYELTDKIVKAISSIKDIAISVGNLSNDDINKYIRATLFAHLNISLSMAASFKPSFLGQLTRKNFFDVHNIKLEALSIRKSFMLRREYMLIPFLFYVTDQLPEEFNLVSKDLWNEIIKEGNKFRITPNVSKFNPLIPSLFDISMSEFVYLLNKNSSKDGDIFHTYKRADNSSSYTYLDDIVETYNSTHKYQFKIKIEKEGIKQKRHVIEQTDKITFLNNKKTNPDKTVGLANIKVGNNRINDCIKDNGICKTTQIMYRRHRKLLDMAEKEKVQLMVLPEVFVPLQFIYAYENESVHNALAFIFGLEHFHVSNKCFNMSCILLPFYINNKCETLPLFRIKNYYSPSETESILKTKSTIPYIHRSYYHWVDWYGLQFSLFNCYELTNIIDRSLFKQKVDTLFAIEYNKDTRYYSNVAEATARDNDCFFIQANSSDYGDTRIVSPQKDILKDKVRIKGGENDVILTCTLDISGLRNHLLGQIPEKDDIYKKTAAGFDKVAVKSRINYRNRLKILGIEVKKEKVKKDKSK